MAGIIVSKIFGLEVFSWGSDSLSHETNVIEVYIKIVKLVDK